MKMINLPNLKFEHSDPYNKMGGRIGWTAHRVVLHQTLSRVLNRSPLRRATHQLPTSRRRITVRELQKYHMGIRRSCRVQKKNHQGKPLGAHGQIMKQTPEEIRLIILDYCRIQVKFVL